MVIDGDKSIALPSPPPPRPAARRAAIETALRKFDGIEETPVERDARKRPSRIEWSTIHRRPAGALMTAALIAIVCIPAVQIVLRDQSPGVVSQTDEPTTVQPGRDAALCEGADCVGQAMPAPETRQARSEEEVAAASPSSPAQPPAPSPIVAESRRERASAENDQKAALEAPAPVVAAAPSPPPSPTEAEGADSIVVTGSRIPAANLSKQDFARAAERVAEPASPLVMIDRYGEFLSRLQTGLRSHDRRAVVGLIGFPLRVNLNGRTRTYRSSRDVERDFARIFTPQVRSAVLNQRPQALISRDGGRMLSNGRLRFGQSCSNKSCSSDGSIRIVEVTP